jgi:type IV pilus assembly protein PilC
MFSKRLSLNSLVELCRSLRYSLSSGLTLRDTMALLATKGDPRLRPVAEEIGKEIKSGWSLQDALKKQEKVFPPLFLALCTVGEESGNLPEILAELERYYIVQQKLRREFVKQITWPILQLFLAVMVISGLIVVLDLIVPKSGESIDALGVGLKGVKGARIFLEWVFGVIFGLWFAMWLTKKLLSRRAIVESILLNIPMLGPTLRSVALARFCVSLHLMLETNLSVNKTIRLALMATDNAAFIAKWPVVETALRKGENITSALAETNLFPARFMGTVAIGEENGRLPEILKHAAEEWEEESRRRLDILNRATSYLVWLVVMILMGVAIFRIFMIYYDKIQNALDATNAK